MLFNNAQVRSEFSHIGFSEYILLDKNCLMKALDIAKALDNMLMKFNKSFKAQETRIVFSKNKRTSNVVAFLLKGENTKKYALDTESTSSFELCKEEIIKDNFSTRLIESGSAELLEKIEVVETSAYTYLNVI